MAWLATTATSAHAFCRTMTCNPRQESCARDEANCVTTGVPIRWKALPLPYRFHRGGSANLLKDEARAAIRAAFARWSDVVCENGQRTALRFAEGEEVDEDKPLLPSGKAAEPFGVYFRDLGWPHDDPGEVLALTNHTFGKNSGTIEYADLEVNTGAHQFSTGEVGEGIDLQSVITHEAGHYLGLAHSRVENSIMVESYCQIGNRCAKGTVAARRLSNDDIAAVCAIYPPDLVLTPPEDQSGGIQCNASRAGGGAQTSRATSTKTLLSVSPIVLAVAIAVSRRNRFLGRARR